MENLTNTMQDFELLEKWNEATKALNYYKEFEVLLRKEILNRAFKYDENSLETGTKRINFAGFNLKTILKTSKTLDAKKLDEVSLKLNELGLFDMRAQSAIVFKPSLSLSEYKKLSEQQKQIFSVAITEKSALPTLEIEIDK